MTRRARRAALPLLATALGLCSAASAAFAAPSLPLVHAGRWITDASGRVVIVHGINMVYKLPPYYPAAVGFGDDDAAFLARIGFNAVRVGVIWKAVEPAPGVYDGAYLAAIAKTVNTLARHGILSLLDFHQDLYNERFQGEGAPDWAVQSGGRANPKDGFPGNYLVNPALQHALDAFFGNAAGPGGIGLDIRFARAWKRVAARFQSSRHLLGYELFNEPFPGTKWTTCAVACTFDAKLTALYRRVDAAIRGADRRALVWYEPNVLFNDGAPTALRAVDAKRAGFAFHDYCLTQPKTGTSTACTAADNLVFSHALARVVHTHEALMLTEFGATTDTAYLTEMAQRADRNMVPWLEWAYCGCGDPTTSGPGDQQAIVRNPAVAPRGANLVLPTLHALVEPYPQVIAGTPTSWSFDRISRTFRLAFVRRRANGRGSFGTGSITEIAVPSLVYGGRYRVSVTGGRVVSGRGASTLRIAVVRGAKQVTVTVKAR